MRGEDDHPRSSVRTRGVPRIHLVKVGAVASLPHGKRELGAARGCRWPCGLHPARALGCSSGSRHTAYRRPFGAGIGDRDGLGIDHSGRDNTEDRATRLDARMAVRTAAAVPPLLWKLYSQRIGKLRPALRCLKTMHVPWTLV